MTERAEFDSRRPALPPLGEMLLARYIAPEPTPEQRAAYRDSLDRKLQQVRAAFKREGLRP